ncbi:LLM class flavin-dependent oxidoreductase [Mycoplasma tauri]|uniref:LLM class flavin-dependent oxidoreductase n=1 Tax=Mycoplasma tauri TaxID=547987 RepID=UPI001CBF9159|nr:LLM class flavin-dependent oxidoreductase [Mycoplasma tauri]MBZ4203633.1 LLM class flavin-dependent oxidoreductase [Mycoplasma tauri]
MKVSVLEHGVLVTKNGYKDTYNELENICKFAEDLGFYSFWISEQHNVNTLVITNPLILLNHLANKTKKIHIGCGGIMLKHYQPFSIAEQINTLNLLHKNRFIFGFGSNASTEKITKLMKSDISNESFYSKMLETVNFINNSSNCDVKINPHIQEKIEPVMLITSEQSAIFAAENGFKIVYGWFLQPIKTYARTVIQTYIDVYQKKWGVKPKDIGISVNVVSGSSNDIIESNRKALALFRMGLNDWNEFQIFPLGNEVENYSFSEGQKRNFDRFYFNIFPIKTELDVKSIDELCTYLNIEHLIIMPTMANVDDRKIALKNIANYYKLGDKKWKR